MTTLPDSPDAPDTADVTPGAPPKAAFVLKLPAFEGPLDLLLHLIEREGLDITTVSLLAVTEQYLAQLRATESMNVGALADFVAMGARLLLLKSRALLPREDQPADDSATEEDAADPEALVVALQEYRRYKQAAGHLRSLQDAQRTTYRRTAAPPDMPLPTGLDTVSLDGLVQLFRDVLDRMPAEEVRPTIRREPIRLRDRIARLIERLDVSGQASFLDLVGGAKSRVEVVVDFLAVLELIKARYLEARQDDAFGDIALVRIEGAVAALDGLEAQLAEDFSGT
ncbi:MAG: segregation/condensation protein A [Dehalococcoidia bacterium]|nr:segregation/condensation protein A [Dehalococcoidia bacterium]